MAEQKPGLLQTACAKWRRFIARLLNETHDYFLCYLPSRKGVIPWLLERLFNGIVLDRKQQDVIRQLPADAIVVYTIKYKSYFEYLFYYTRFRTEKLRVPELAFGYRFMLLQPLARFLRSLLSHLDWYLTYWRRMDPYADGYLQRQLLDGRAALLPLVEKHGFYRRFVKAQIDPLRFLIETQQSIDRTIYLIPGLMFFSKSPESGTVRPACRCALVSRGERSGISPRAREWVVPAARERRFAFERNFELRRIYTYLKDGINCSSSDILRFIFQ